MVRIPAISTRTVAALLLLPLAGCIGNRVSHPILPTAEELAAFEAAGPAAPDENPDQLVALNVGKQDYKVVDGDLLEVEVPSDIVDAQSEDYTTKVRARVQTDGTIRFDLAGAVPVEGLTTPEIEERLATEIEQKSNRKEKPAIVVTVVSYRSVSVAVFGAVTNAGIFPLRSDRRSLLGAIMAAGGIKEDGASTIRVIKPTESGPPDIQVLPVRGSTIPLEDVALEGGETIVVDPQDDLQIAVIGLVRRPGQFQYPLHRTYNLQQAIAVAGGTDSTAAPRYATIYRKDAEGHVLRCNFKIDGAEWTSAASVLVKPGDVISLEHTEGTWLRTFISSVFGFRVSASASSQSSGL